MPEPPAPVPPPIKPTNWPNLLATLWGFRPVRLSVCGAGLLVLGMVLGGWVAGHKPEPAAPIAFTETQLRADVGEYVKVTVKASRNVGWFLDDGLGVLPEPFPNAKYVRA